MTENDGLVKMLSSLRDALMGISSSLDLIAIQALVDQTCDSSIQSALPDEYLGPCVLRAGHKGPLHRDIEGTTWTSIPSESTSLPDLERPLHPSGWTRCGTWITEDEGETRCADLPRIPDYERGHHLHPHQVETESTHRRPDGGWVVKDPKLQLSKEQREENNHIDEWWRRYGQQ